MYQPLIFYVIYIIASWTPSDTYCTWLLVVSLRRLQGTTLPGSTRKTASWQMEMASDASGHFKWMVDGRVGKQHMLSPQQRLSISYDTRPKGKNRDRAPYKFELVDVSWLSLKCHVWTTHMSFSNRTLPNEVPTSQPMRNTKSSGRNGARPVTFDVDCQGLLLRGFWFGCGLGRITVTLIYHLRGFFCKLQLI